MKFFIIKIVYKSPNRCIRLLFKKYTINLRVITLKLHAYTYYSNENIIKKTRRITIVIYVNNYYIYKRIKASRDREHDLL